MEKLKLKGGDPKGKNAASYTRFVMPFAYTVERTDVGNEEVVWEEIKEEDPNDLKWRKQYLTQETAKVLFENAKWFELKSKVNDKFVSYKKDIGITFKMLDSTIRQIAINAPKLILFECNLPDSKGLAANSPMRTGFLVIEINFQDETTLDEMLLLNEALRYKEPSYEAHRKEIFGDEKEKGKLCVSPDGLEKLFEGKNGKIFWDIYEFLLSQPLAFNNVPFNLIEPRNDQCNGKELEIYADNRAFVWTCAVLKGGGEALRQHFPIDQYREKYRFDLKEWEAHQYGHWIKLLNVDQPGKGPEATHQSRAFEREWAKEHTYHRWEEWGTYYGFSYHSGALLCDEIPDLPLWRHFGQMYFDMFLLLFYIRVVLFRFSNRLTEISVDARSESSSKHETWQREFEEMRWQFTLFTNLYQFPLISNQQQGLELYELARKHLDIQELFNEIEKEIHSSHDYLSQQQNQEQTNITTILTVIAAVFSIVAIGLTLVDKKDQLTVKNIIDGVSGEAIVAWSLSIISFFIVLILSKYLAGIFKWFAELLSKAKK
ncbi:MAG: hypothetical protein AB1757_09255 [Acidobacteriota bacterium]